VDPNTTIIELGKRVLIIKLVATSSADIKVMYYKSYNDIYDVDISNKLISTKMQCQPDIS
jgi:hypothetical protein